MGHHFARERVLLAHLDLRQPDFAHQCIVWSAQTQREIQELVAATKTEIATSKDLMAEADRMLARR